MNVFTGNIALNFVLEYAAEYSSLKKRVCLSMMLTGDCADIIPLSINILIFLHCIGLSYSNNCIILTIIISI